jgi:nucleotide-binding universal stress UspA family protein
MAEKFSDSLYIIHVIEETFYHAPYLEAFLDAETVKRISEEMEKKIRQQLDDVCKSKAGMLNEYYPIISRGMAFSEIISIAKKKETDLIIMSTHGRTGLGHVLFGGVAERVLREAPCPVLTVHMSDKGLKEAEKP